MMRSRGSSLVTERKYKRPTRRLSGATTSTTSFTTLIVPLFNSHSLAIPSASWAIIPPRTLRLTHAERIRTDHVEPGTHWQDSGQLESQHPWQGIWEARRMVGMSWTARVFAVTSRPEPARTFHTSQSELRSLQSSIVPSVPILHGTC